MYTELRAERIVLKKSDIYIQRAFSLHILTNQILMSIIFS